MDMFVSSRRARMGGECVGVLMSRLLQRLLKLPEPETRDLVVDRGLRVEMRDGAVLLADRWSPSRGGDGLPVALLRCPYGRSAGLWVRPLAERGFQVLIQSTRGTFGSGGRFVAYTREREDGLDTLNWIADQPWFGGSVVLVGGSYLGYSQWAVADAAPPFVAAMVPTSTESAQSLEFLRADGFSLETPFGWAMLMSRQEERLGRVRHVLARRRDRRALDTLPLAQADLAARGCRSDHFRDVLDHEAGDPFWTDLDHRRQVPEIEVPVSSVGGWYDLFLPGQLRDFQILQGAGRAARLTVGPWTHASVAGSIGTATREALDFGLPHARRETPTARAPVQLFVMGQGRWRDFSSWPPPGYTDERFHLRAGGRLSTAPPGTATSGSTAPDTYRYDPRDPTPAVGGIRLSGSAGRVDNRRLEARPDVLIYTSDRLGEDIEVIGEVRADIFFRSSLPHADVFVRLCDVDARGRSWNVCDGLTSSSGTDDMTTVAVRLWPTAYRFARGHRIRVQVSSGAFPRFDRNLGSGEARGQAQTPRPAEQRVFHDRAHPSAVILPVRRSTS